MIKRCVAILVIMLSVSCLTDCAAVKAAQGLAGLLGTSSSTKSGGVDVSNNSLHSGSNKGALASKHTTFNASDHQQITITHHKETLLERFLHNSLIVLLAILILAGSLGGFWLGNYFGKRCKPV